MGGLTTASKTGKMKGFICQVEGIFIEYPRLADALAVI